MSDTDTTIRPALTPEEWTRVLAEPDPMRRHALARPHRTAALALYDQPFGFTREGLSALLRIVDIAADAPDSTWDRFGGSAADKEGVFTLACAELDKLAALLPPETP